MISGLNRKETPDNQELAAGAGVLGSANKVRSFIGGNQILRATAVTLWYMAVVTLSYYVAFVRRFYGDIPLSSADVLYRTLPILVLVRIITFQRFGLYSGLLRYVSVDDVWRAMKAVTVSTLIFMVVVYLMLPGFEGFPRSIFIIETMLSLGIIAGHRMSLRALRESSRNGTGVGQGTKKILLVGDLDAADCLLRVMASESKGDDDVVGIVQEGSLAKGRKLHNVRVFGGREEIPAIIEKERPAEVYILPPYALSPSSIRDVMDRCNIGVDYSCEFKTIPSLLDIADGKATVTMVRRGEKSVLVIGGAGYIGSALLLKLLDKGYRVRLLDLLLYGTDPIKEAMDHPRLELIQADFRHVDKVVDAMQGMDAVVHLGGIVGDPACALDEDLTIDVNLMATRMVAEVAKGSGVGRFIFASSCSVYGADSEILDERSMLNPVSLYARSKIASERVLMQMATPNFSHVILRFGTIYGLSGRYRFDLIVNLLAAKSVFDGEITIFGGDQWRPFLHVDDAALAILRVLEAPISIAHNQIFNVGSDEQNYRIAEIGEMVHRVVPSAKLLQLGEDTDKRDYRVNFRKIRNVLDFVPQWTVEEGIQQVLGAVKSGRIKDYRAAEYNNVKFLADEPPEALPRSQISWAYDLINDDLSSETRRT